MAKSVGSYYSEGTTLCARGALSTEYVRRLIMIEALKHSVPENVTLETAWVYGQMTLAPWRNIEVLVKKFYATHRETLIEFNYLKKKKIAKYLIEHLPELGSADYRKLPIAPETAAAAKRAFDSFIQNFANTYNKDGHVTEVKNYVQHNHRAPVHYTEHAHFDIVDNLILDQFNNYGTALATVDSWRPELHRGDGNAFLLDGSYVCFKCLMDRVGKMNPFEELKNHSDTTYILSMFYHLAYPDDTYTATPAPLNLMLTRMLDTFSKDVSIVLPKARRFSTAELLDVINFPDVLLNGEMLDNGGSSYRLTDRPNAPRSLSECYLVLNKLLGGNNDF